MGAAGVEWRAERCEMRDQCREDGLVTYQSVRISALCRPHVCSLLSWSARRRGGRGSGWRARGAPGLGSVRAAWSMPCHPGAPPGERGLCVPRTLS